MNRLNLSWDEMVEASGMEKEYEMKKTVSKETENLANERIEESRKKLAKIVCQLEGLTQTIKYACESMDWNDEVAFLVEEAATKLGYALATLDTWDDELEE